MKNNPSSKKLSLKKETITKLNDQQMNAVVGGDTVFSVQVTYCWWACIKLTNQGTCPAK